MIFFLLSVLMVAQLIETRTTKGGSDCPTLLHYLARVLMRKDPTLVNFIDELPNLEPAARGEFHAPRLPSSLISHP